MISVPPLHLEYPATGLPAPGIADGVRQFMKATMAQPSAGTEHSWACDWDPELRMITGARLIGRGGLKAAIVIPRDLQEGQLFVHSHPPDLHLAASDPDLRSAENLDNLGIGSAIVSQDAGELYVVREPRPLEKPQGKTTQMWKVGRLLVVWCGKS